MKFTHVPQEKYVFFGWGISTQAAFKVLTNLLGVSEKHITIVDDQQSKFVTSKDVLKNLADYDKAILSPGFPRSSKVIQEFIRLKGEDKIFLELDVAAAIMKKEGLWPRVAIGVTGSSGKSTTCAMINHGLLSDKRSSALVGNFGLPLCELLLASKQKQVPLPEHIVFELSSYQLETIKELQFNISIITSLSPNHLDRYAGEEDYYQTKFKICDMTDGPVLLNQESKALVTWAENKLRENKKLQWANRRVWSEQKVIGAHNEQNLNLAADVFDMLGLRGPAYEALLSFYGLPHRLEFCGDYKGLSFINDSKATTIDSVLRAVSAVCNSQYMSGESQTLHLILGGKDKSLPWIDLRELASVPHIKCYFYGEVGKKAKEESTLFGGVYKTLSDVVKETHKCSTTGDVVLLSPGGSSLDQYKNFEERGEHFKKLIEEL